MEGKGSSGPRSLDLVETLSSGSGFWTGDGINHQNQTFHALLLVRRLFGAQPALLWFKAAGDGGVVYHEEVSLFGPGMDGSLTMVSANTNIPFVQEFGSSARGGAFDFHHGDHSRHDTFREIVSFDLISTGEVRLTFKWGMPGEVVSDRSSAKLTRSNAPPSDAPIR
ncbi:MAG: hypothetical protein WAW96_10770 [Alphaproteobacteria bacterium]